jgi:quercetin dioxygenase-like cupin family protein
MSATQEQGSGKPSYVRLFTDVDGETHFEDVYLNATLERHGSGARTAVTPLVPVEGLIFRRIVDPAISEEPHNAPYALFIITLAGAAEVTVSDGETRTFGPGDVVLAEDTTGKGHTTRDAGDTPRVTLFAPLRLER